MRNLVLLLSFLCSVSLYAKGNAEFKFKDGKFRIIQFTDIHYTPNNKNADTSLELMKMALAKEKPDLVVFSGDVVVSKGNQQGWDEVLEPVIDAKVPYVVVFGNHDDEGVMTREQIHKYIITKPYNVNGDILKGVYGVTNQVIEFKGEDGKVKNLCWLFDSNAYSTIKGVSGYGWIEKSQIEWYSNKSKEFALKNDGKPVPSLAFFHIALPEHRVAYDKPEGLIVGTRGEHECPPDENSGLFLEMLKQGNIMGVFVGHDHDNDYVSKYRDILLGFGKFSGSKTTYTSKGSGARMFELVEGEREFKTWVLDSDSSERDFIDYPKDYNKGGKYYREPVLDSISYAIGVKLGEMIYNGRLNADQKEINLNQMLNAIKDVARKVVKYDENKIDSLVNSYFIDENFKKLSK